MSLIDSPLANAPFGVKTPLRHGQRSLIWIASADGSECDLIWEEPFRLEAPNWAPDDALIVNGGGKLFEISPDRRSLREIAVDGIDDINNDHVLSPNGRIIYISAGGVIYSVARSGGQPLRLSPDDGDYYLHGISPDGSLLACTVKDGSRPEAPWGIRVFSANGGPATTLIEGSQPVDGPEWSPDGEWIWFNGELAADYPGHAQIFRMRPDGSEVTRIVASETVDWFPHHSPDGNHIVYLSYPKGTRGHPPDRDVQLKMLRRGENAPRLLAEFFGGQGTVNVNSWSPDSTRFAFVSFPLANPAMPEMSPV